MNKSDGNGRNSFQTRKSVSDFTNGYSPPARAETSASRDIPPEPNDSSDPDRQRQIVGLSKRGHRLLKGKEFQAARDIFEQACELDGHNPYILSGLAECLKHLGQLPAAIACYEKLLVLEPDNQFALRGLGDLFKLRNEYDRAIALWTEYLKYRANDIFVLTRIADALKILNRFKEAEDWYRKVLVLNPADRYSLMGLADLYHKTGREKPAIEYYEKILEKSPEMINILTIVGNLYRQLEDFGKAQSCFVRALELEPKNSYALTGLGHCHRWNRDYAQAIECWEPLLQSGEITNSMLSRLGDMYRNLGRLEEAEKLYLRGLEAGYDRYPHLGLIKLMCLRGREEEVCRLSDEYFSREGFDLETVKELSELYLQTGRKDAAAHFYYFILATSDLNSEETRLIEGRAGKLEK